MNFTIYTLVTEKYFPGLLALINSLRINGFSGEIVVGIKGDISFQNKIKNIRIVDLNNENLSIGFLKSKLILDNPCSKYIFLDSDIIINHFKFFEILDEYSEVNPIFPIESILPNNDIRRLRWYRAFNLINEKCNETQLNSIKTSYYVNAGFFCGIWERDKHILEKWDYNIRKFFKDEGYLFSNPIFPMADQDVLNATIQVENIKYSSLNYPDVLSAALSLNPFLQIGIHNEYLLLHGTGLVKTWDIKSIPIYSPNAYDLAWYKYAIIENDDSICKLKISRKLRWWLERRSIIKYYQRFSKII